MFQFIVTLRIIGSIKGIQIQVENLQCGNFTNSTLTLNPKDLKDYKISLSETHVFFSKTTLNNCLREVTYWIVILFLTIRHLPVLEFTACFNSSFRATNLLRF